MSTPKPPSVARLAVNTIKEAKEAGEELGRLITDMQAQNERQIRQYHNRVIRERQEAREHDLDLDQRAHNEWMAEQDRERNRQQVIAQVEARYGKGSWARIEAMKSRMVAIEQEDKKHADEMRHKMDDLLWWCMGVAALITYPFKLYK